MQALPEKLSLGAIGNPKVRLNAAMGGFYVDTGIGSMPIPALLHHLTPPPNHYQNPDQAWTLGDIQLARGHAYGVLRSLNEYRIGGRRSQFAHFLPQLAQLKAMTNTTYNQLTAYMNAYETVATEGIDAASDRGFAEMVFQRFSRRIYTIKEAIPELAKRGVEVKYRPDGTPYGSPIDTPEGRRRLAAARSEFRTMSSGRFDHSTFDSALSRPESFTALAERKQREAAARRDDTDAA